VPELPGELDHDARFLEQRHDFRADQPSVQLADRIDAATQQPNARQVSQLGRMAIEEQSPGWGFLEVLINTNLVFNAHSLLLQIATNRHCSVGFI